MKLKRYFALLLAMCMALGLLSGCGGTENVNPASVPASTSEPEESEAPEELEEPEALEDPEAECYELDTEDRFKIYEYDISSTFQKETDTNVSRYYTEDGMLQVMYSPTARNDLSDSKAMTEGLEGTISGIEKSAGVTNLTAEYDKTVAGRPAARFECKMIISGTWYHTLGLVFIDEDGVCTLIACDSDLSERLLKSFDAIVDSIRLFEPENDFLKDEETRNAVSNDLNSYRFDDIAALAEAYIAEQNPAETDSVYAILQYAQDAQLAMENCTVVTDEFEGDSVLYGRVNEISSTVSFVPFIEKGITSSYLKVMVGFVKSDWLFMERAKIKVGEDDFITKSFDYFKVTRDVIKGSTVLEECKWDMKYEDVEQILNTESPALRFEGEDDKTFDHAMTDDEIESLRSIYDVSVCINGIREIVSQWMDHNVR